ncbi:MAG: hypothetical protein K6E51_09655 [Treponema sp.]|nr:hypothetical protein [Treponema sp.]
MAMTHSPVITASTTEEGAMYHKTAAQIITYIGKRMLMLIAKLFSMQTVHTVFITLLCKWGVISSEQWMGIFIVLIVRSGSDRIADKLGVSLPDIIAASRGGEKLTGAASYRSYENDTIQNTVTDHGDLSVTGHSSASTRKRIIRSGKNKISTILDQAGY